MAVIYSDNFSGITGQTLSQYSGMWIRLPSNSIDALIEAGRVRVPTTGTIAYRYDQIPASADYSVSADLVFVGSAITLPGVCGRIQGGTFNTYYMARFLSNAQSVEMYKFVSGTATVITTVAVPTPLNVGETARLTLDMSGSTIRALWNGVEFINVTDTSIPGTGCPGFRVTATGAQSATAGIHLDNFSTEDAAAAPVNAAPTFPGTIANISGTAGTAIAPVNAAGQFSDTDTISYSASPGGTAWPAGLTINPSTGVISGTVAQSTTAGLKVRATDTAGQTVDSNAFSVTIAAAPVGGTTGTLTTQAFKNGTGQVLPNLTGLNIAVLALPALTMVKNFAGETTDAAGLNVVSDALIVSGTKYAHVTTNAVGSVIGADLITAT